MFPRPGDGRLLPLLLLVATMAVRKVTAVPMKVLESASTNQRRAVECATQEAFLCITRKERGVAIAKSTTGEPGIRPIIE
jgi:hypothetical protein